MSVLSSVSPQSSARTAGFFYLLTFVGGIIAIINPGARDAGNLAGALAYVIVTVLFYEMFKPVNAGVSLIAAVFSIVGCVGGALPALHLPALPVNPLAFFGVYCLLIGYLIFNSTFLPRILGVLMAIGGLGWLTFASPSLASGIAPYNLVPGMLGEGALTLWLLARGVDPSRWEAAANSRQLL